MKRIFFIGILFSIFLSACLDVDNYDGPNAGIDGKLIDTGSGNLVYTEQPDGCRIQLMDLGYENPTPLTFWVKANGSFRNVALFGGDYDITPIEGPFFPIEKTRVKLSGVTSHDFQVTPFLQLEISEIIKGEPSSASVTIKYKIKRSTTPEGFEIGQKTISEAWILCNTNPIVSYYNSGYDANLSVKKEFSRTADGTIEQTIYESSMPGLISGQKYYIRLASLSTCSYNTLKRYNYTEIMEIVAP